MINTILKIKELLINLRLDVLKKYKYDLEENFIYLEIQKLLLAIDYENSN